MTCILAWINSKEKKTYLVADNLATAGSRIYHSENSSKISTKEVLDYKHQPHIIHFGGSGYARAIQLVEHSLRCPTIPEEYRNNFQGYLVNLLIPELRRVFLEHGYEEDTRGIVSHESTFLIVYKNEIFVLHSNYQLSLFDLNYASVGSGSDYALGALSMLSKSLNGDDASLEDLFNVMDSVSFHCSNVGGTCWYAVSDSTQKIFLGNLS